MPEFNVSTVISLGANLGDKIQTITGAIEALRKLPKTRLLKSSGLYRSAPVGPPQPHYINAVALLRTQLEPFDLLAKLQSIEKSFGRKRDGPRWGARTLDLDIITFSSLCLNDPNLIVPHPEAHCRHFVLAPLADISPDLIIPNYGKVAELLAQCRTGWAVKLTEYERAH